MKTLFAADRGRQELQVRESALGLAIILAGMLGLSAVAGNAVATETDDKSRYTLMRDGDSFIRMDNETGTMSICKRKSDQLVCQMAADDREAIEAELDTLLSRIDRLEASRRHSFDNHSWADDESFEEFDRELDKLLGYSVHTLKRFKGVMRELERDWAEE